MEKSLTLRSFLGGTALLVTLTSAGVWKWNDGRRHAKAKEVPASGVVLNSIKTHFEGALIQQSLVRKVRDAFSKRHEVRKTLVASTVDSPSLERAFAKLYGGGPYRLGGLAGFPFGGKTAYSTMVSHLPDDGVALIVFCPSMNLDSEGVVSAESAVQTALEHVLAVHNGIEKPLPPPTVDSLDAPYELMEHLLLPYAARLAKAGNVTTELSHVLYEIQKELITDIVTTDDTGTPAMVLGGIDIRTPAGVSDYFMPLSLEVYNGTGEKFFEGVSL